MAKGRREISRKEADNEDQGMRSALFYWLQALVVALVALTLIFSFFGRIIGVVGHSMDQTLANGEILFCQSFGYTPKQGDILVLNDGEASAASVLEGRAIVKRCIAVGGQTVKIDYDDGTVSVDGEVLDEPYLWEKMRDPRPFYPSMGITEITVPEGEIFVMGDNRNDSTDSRHIDVGTIDQRYVLGRAVCILFPLNKLQILV